MAKVSIKGLNRSEVLAALYNAARPQGMGFLHYNSTPMTIVEADKILNDDNRYSFDYLMGRVMKISLAGDEFESASYDRDNGFGNASLVVKSIRVGLGPDNEITREIHKDGKEAAAKLARLEMDKSSIIVETKNAAELHMGLNDIKDQLGPAVDKALEK